MIKKNEPEVTILNVTLKIQDGKKVLNWDFPHSVNIYFLLGVLDAIKHDLLFMAEESEYEDINEEEDL